MKAGGGKGGSLDSTLKALVLADCEAVPRDLGSETVDLVIGCGDVPDWVLVDAAERCSCKRILAVKGNHDASRDFSAPIESLHLKIRHFKEVAFGGFNGASQYKPRGNFLYSQEQAAELLHVFPEVDVMVTHNSPAGVHERGDPAHIGFIGLRQYVFRARPAFLLHGHQHKEADSLLGETRIIGVCGFRIMDLEFPPPQEK
jgi:Icc-related predicted phosphoesterase